MKKVILLVILLVIVAGGSLLILTQIDEFNNSINKLTAPNQGIGNPVSAPVIQTKLQYYKDDAFGLNVVIFKNTIDFYYQVDEKKTLKELGNANNLIFATNGGYFTEDYSHAGLLMINNTIEVPIARLDKQVTHIVTIDSDANTIDFAEAKIFDPQKYINNDNFIAFQTGPLIIQNNIVQNTYIDSSPNGTGSYLRTVLGITKSGKRFFATVTIPNDLKSIAKKLLELPLFKDEIISVVNLDGGSSTAMFSSENNDFNFRTYKQLPIILGVKEDKL